MRCPATGCTRNVRSEKFLCFDHWRMVPADLQTQVYRTWRERVDAAKTRLEGGSGQYARARVAHEDAKTAALRAVNQQLGE